jgi:peptidoglycan/LPS O-acetylase OafA/YrhL
MTESVLSPTENLQLDTTPIATSERFHIPSLDGIRAVAFGLVFVAHAWEAHLGMFAVTTFFFLSGFLITTLMRREIELSGSISIRNFYFRRALRIFPPLYLTIGFVFVLAVTHALIEREDPGTFLAASAFVTNYRLIFKGVNSGLGLLWSLAVEEHFYCVFPFLFLFMNKIGLSYKNQAWALSGLCLAFLAWRSLLVFHYSSVFPEKYFLYASDTRMDSILFGCILALGANPILDRRVFFSKMWSVSGIFLLLLSFCIRNNSYRITLHYTLQGLALIPIFTLVICRAGDWFRWLNIRAVRFVGSLSYTMYLVHMSILFVIVPRIRSHSFAVFLTLTLTFLYAYAMNQFVERPLARIRRRLKSERQSSSSPALLQ